MSLRRSIAQHAVGIVNRVSRGVGRGQGTVAGGRVGLRIDPTLLQELTKNKTVFLVSGTNGKTTTTALLRAALTARFANVASNLTGSNMPPGHVAALCEEPNASVAVLEVDERYLGQALQATNAEFVTLLNLSRDQLDRMSEVRMLSERWRDALTDQLVTVIANGDDPLVVFAASRAKHVIWVRGGLVWNQDATGCPQCLGHITYGADGEWSCDQCALRRPECTWFLEEGSAHSTQETTPLSLRLPGLFNRSNALLALASAVSAGVRQEVASQAMSQVDDVAGRFHHIEHNGESTRLMLAKNPAGWAALLDLVGEDSLPLVIGINSRTADGEDPSWLFDVPFQELRSRRVIATGDRWRDLSVRLGYAEVTHEVCESPLQAIALAHQGTTENVDFIGNYTSFQDVMKAQR